MRTDEGVCPYYITLSFLLCYSVFPSYYAVPRWQEPLERKQGNALLNARRAFPCFEEGVPLYQRGRLLVMRKRLLILNVTPQRRDRRPRLSAQHPYYSLIYSSFSGQTRASVPTMLLCLSYFVTLSSLLIMLSLVDKNRWIIFELT